MEDWKITQDVEIGHDDIPNRWTDRSRSFASSIHDGSLHWKPSESSVHATDGLHRINFDDTDTFIQNAVEPMVTLIEEETCAEHVINVWDEISRYIVEKMKDGFAVKIAGLGTFTFAEQLKPANTDQDRPTVKRTPFMILSEFVVRMYNLITPLHETLSTLPTIQLNLSLIAKRTHLNRRIVEGVLTEVLQAFARALVCNKNLEFPFPNIGKLQVLNRKVVFKFYADFCTQLDLSARYPSPPVDYIDPFVLPGTMTPLRRHIPSSDFRSVFHLREIRSVHGDDLLAPVKEIKGKHEVVSRIGNDAEPVYTLVEDTSQPVKFKKEQLSGPSLNKRYTVHWVRQKRDYLNGSSKPWPPHHYHVVESSVVLPKRAPGTAVDLEPSFSRSGGYIFGNKKFGSEAGVGGRHSSHNQPRQSENFYQFYSRVSKNLSRSGDPYEDETAE